MAELPQMDLDPTLEALDRALEARRGVQRRGHLGLSQLGDACRRRVWLRFRWAMAERMSARGIRNVESGDIGESVMASRLRDIDGVDLQVVDVATGDQHSVRVGHVAGSLDGVVRGLLQAPKTWHVWEHKVCNEKKWRLLVRLKKKHGEKAALAHWDEVYHVQAQCYMRLSGLTRHYLTVSTPGERETVSVRTELDKKYADTWLSLAAELATTDRAPAAFIEGSFTCKWCDLTANCHGVQLAERNCRTCLHVTPEADGTWRCEKWKKTLLREEQEAGCGEHRYLPDLVPGEQVDVDGETVVYRLRDGREWRDEG